MKDVSGKLLRLHGIIINMEPALMLKFSMNILFLVKFHFGFVYTSKYGKYLNSATNVFEEKPTQTHTHEINKMLNLF